jgi:hypothetical protein
MIMSRYACEEAFLPAITPPATPGQTDSEDVGNRSGWRNSVREAASLPDICVQTLAGERLI